MELKSDKYDTIDGIELGAIVGVSVGGYDGIDVKV